MPAPVIGFVGMTHLGIVSAMASAAKGFETVCVDTDPGLIADLSVANLPITEPGLPELMAANRERLSFAADPSRLAACDIVYVAPDVATDDDGNSDTEAVARFFDLTRAHTREDAVIVLLSQVPPRFTRQRAGDGRSVFYQVETLIFGDAVARALAPERIIVGAADPDAALPGAYRGFLDCFDCPLMVMRYESAELAKISINCFLAASISTTNTLAELCEAVGANWSEIAPALRLDKRIGPHAYLTPGLGIAGGNLERDLASVCGMASAQGTDGGVVSAWLQNSRHRKGWAFRVLDAQLLRQDPRAKIAILGLAYKENTHSTKNAASLALLDALSETPVMAYDPVVNALNAGNLTVAESALAAVHGADAVAIMTPWDEFRNLDAAAVASAMSGNLLLDPYGVVDPLSAENAGLRYRTLGVSDSLV